MKATLTHNDVTKTFREAWEDESKFVFVTIEAEGVVEVIAIPSFSFKEKENFYLRSYTHDLKHVMNKNVFIIGINHGDKLTEDALIATTLDNMERSNEQEDKKKEYANRFSATWEGPYPVQVALRLWAMGNVSVMYKIGTDVRIMNGKTATTHNINKVHYLKAEWYVNKTERDTFLNKTNTPQTK